MILFYFCHRQWITKPPAKWIELHMNMSYYSVMHLRVTEYLNFFYFFLLKLSLMQCKTCFSNIFVVTYFIHIYIYTSFRDRNTLLPAIHSIAWYFTKKSKNYITFSVSWTDDFVNEILRSRLSHTNIQSKILRYRKCHHTN